MCAFVGISLLMFVGAFEMFKVGEIGLGIVCVIVGLMFFSPVLDGITPSPRIDVAVRNKVVAHDGNGRYLVEADTSRQILGPRPHTSQNMPAGLYQVRSGLWIVDSTGGSDPTEIKIEWQPVDGNYQVVPRGSEPRDFLKDVVEGSDDHTYIQEVKE